MDTKLTLLIAATAGITLLAAEEPVTAIPTFESLSLYYNRSAAKECKVEYRVAGSAKWQPAYPLVYDQRERQYRGSLVGLTPNTLYDIRIDADGDKVALQARTRSEEFPVGKITHLPGGTTDQPLTIREGGTATAWHLVTPTPGTKY